MDDKRQIKYYFSSPDWFFLFFSCVILVLIFLLNFEMDFANYFTDDDEERLIDFVRTHTELIDPSNKFYKNQTVRKRLWAECAEEIGKTRKFWFQLNSILIYFRFSYMLFLVDSFIVSFWTFFMNYFFFIRYLWSICLLLYLCINWFHLPRNFTGAVEIIFKLVSNFGRIFIQSTWSRSR